MHGGFEGCVEAVAGRIGGGFGDAGDGGLGAGGVGFGVSAEPGCGGLPEGVVGVWSVVDGDAHGVR